MDSLKYAAETLARYVEARKADYRTRLQTGARRRKTIGEQLQAGLEPRGPRVDWVQEGSQQVIELLVELGEEFNSVHDDDMVSLMDMLDILATARHRLIRSRQE